MELADPLGTKRVQVNSAGLTDETCTSLPFGNDVNNPYGASCSQPTNPPSTADDATEHHFTSKERDSESGNDYFEARYYSSAMGRFVSPDWSAKGDPIPYAKLDDPQSLNLYGYLRGNPLGGVDFDGHDGPDCGCQTLKLLPLPTKQDLIFGTVVAITLGRMVLHDLNPANVFHSDEPAPKGTPASTPSSSEPTSSPANTGTTPLPTGLVGTDPTPKKGKVNSGPMAPEHGGSGDAGKDFGALTGGKSGPAPEGKVYPAGTQIGENGIQLRPGTDTAGPRIDIPKNGPKPHEVLHYPPPPPPPPPTRPTP